MYKFVASLTMREESGVTRILRLGRVASAAVSKEPRLSVKVLIRGSFSLIDLQFVSPCFVGEPRCSGGEIEQLIYPAEETLWSYLSPEETD